ncbi:MAG: Crp/Fnr family transcriptional regulator [Bacteroidia bacterium]
MLDKETIEAIASKTQKKSIKKGEFLLRKGESSVCIFVVLEGCLRSYLVDKKGKEHTIQFAQEDCVIADFECLTRDSPAVLHIDALESSEVYIFNKSDAIGADNEMLAIYNKLYHEQVTVLQRRVMQLLSGTADERYLEFSRVFPSLLKRVPQKMIASYLGIAPESLSRVRNEIAKRKKGIS